MSTNMANSYEPKLPSPLAQVHYARPASYDPSRPISQVSNALSHYEVDPNYVPGVVRDLPFWNRLGVAIFRSCDEKKEIEEEKRARKSRKGSFLTASEYEEALDGAYRHENWLYAQQRERRKYRRVCKVISTVFLCALIGSSITAYIFTHRNGSSENDFLQ